MEKGALSERYATCEECGRKTIGEMLLLKLPTDRITSKH
jgi:hypothetical protein